MANYDTLIQALQALKQRGFTTDFNIAFDALACSSTGKCLQPEAFEIIEHYRFEGETDPGDESILYVIEAKDGSLKGTLVSAFGIYSDPMSDELVKKLSFNKH